MSLVLSAICATRVQDGLTEAPNRVVGVDLGTPGRVVAGRLTSGPVLRSLGCPELSALSVVLHGETRFLVGELLVCPEPITPCPLVATVGASCPLVAARC